MGSGNKLGSRFVITHGWTQKISGQPQTATRDLHSDSSGLDICSRKKKLFKNSEGKPLHIYIQELTRSDGRNGVLSSTRSGGGTLVGAGGTACLRLGWVGRGGTGRLPDQEAVQEPSASATRGDALPLAHPD